MTKLRLSNYLDEYLTDMLGKSKTHEAASNVRKAGVFSAVIPVAFGCHFLCFTTTVYITL